MFPYRQPWVIALGAISLVALITGAWLLLSRESGTGCNDSTLCYYFEAELRIDVPKEIDPEPKPVTLVKTWYRGPLEWRREIFQDSEDTVTPTAWQIADGETVTDYNQDRDSYYSYAIPADIPEENGVVAGYLGPISKELGSSLDEVIARLRTTGQGWTVAGNDDLLGYQVVMVDVQSQDNIVATKLWVDQERMFILKQETKHYNFDGSLGATERSEVTKLDYSPRFQKNTFQFKAPEGSQESSTPLNK